MYRGTRVDSDPACSWATAVLRADGGQQPRLQLLQGRWADGFPPGPQHLAGRHLMRALPGHQHQVAQRGHHPGIPRPAARPRAGAVGGMSALDKALLSSNWSIIPLDVGIVSASTHHEADTFSAGHGVAQPSHRAVGVVRAGAGVISRDVLRERAARVRSRVQEHATVGQCGRGRCSGRWCGGSLHVERSWPGPVLA